jgi:hypothetical protein
MVGIAGFYTVSTVLVEMGGGWGGGDREEVSTPIRHKGNACTCTHYYTQSRNASDSEWWEANPSSSMAPLSVMDFPLTRHISQLMEAWIVLTFLDILFYKTGLCVSGVCSGVAVGSTIAVCFDRGWNWFPRDKTILRWWINKLLIM